MNIEDYTTMKKQWRVKIGSVTYAPIALHKATRLTKQLLHGSPLPLTIEPVLVPLKRRRKGSTQ